jgi:peptidyl-prolyl cis-trans isomerase B (cyclophilin B)
MRYKFLCLLFSFSLMISCAQEKKDYLITISTSYGDMVAILYDETPKHKENFIKLAKEGFYDSLLFHRIIEGFMIQGGDPDSKKATPGQRLGTGNIGYTIDAEFNSKFFHKKGALAAARLGDQQNPKRVSNGSQFYIVQGKPMSEEDLSLDGAKFGEAIQKFMRDPQHKATADSVMQFYQNNDREGYEAFLKALRPRIERETGISTTREVDPAQRNAYVPNGGTPNLDGQYTVFGEVIKGIEVIDKIASQSKDSFDRPIEDIRMKISVKEVSKKKIDKEYGYTYH